MSSPSRKGVLFIGRSNYRDDQRLLGLWQEDRRYHTYIIGQTGTGKSTFLESLIEQDIKNGEGLAILDPHGDFVERLVSRIPASRQADVV